MALSQRIFITGANGFIGGNLIQYLQREGRFEILALVRSDADLWRLKGLDERVKIIKGCLLEVDSYRHDLSNFKPDAVVHLATYYRPEHKLEDIELILRTNVEATAKLLEVCKDVGTDLFVNMSTCFVYGQHFSPVSETESAQPFSLYGRSKLMAEELCTFYAGRNSMRCLSLRLFPPYGSLDLTSKLLPTMVRSAKNGTPMLLSGGEQRWDYVHVSDVVRLIDLLLGTKLRRFSHEVINVGTGHAHSLRDVGDWISKYFKRSEDIFVWGQRPYRDYEPSMFLSANSKACAMFGWQPQVRLFDEGLKTLIQEMENHE